MQAAFRLLFLFFVLSANLWANTPSSPWFSQDADKKTIINVELFLSSTCSHCHKADDFFKAIEPSTPWLHITRYVINENKEALIHFNQLLTDQKMNDFSVPSIFFCNSRWVGFATPETTGKDLLHALEYCKQQIEKKGELSSANVSTLRRWANANLFDSGMTENPTAIKYITVMALMDAFNPCALFCLGCFFALLFVQQRQKDQIIIGLLFLLPLGVTHFFQQVYTSAFFELLPWFRVPAALVGLFTLYLVSQLYKKRTTSNLFFLLSLLLGIVLLSYQQTCVMNWSLIFEQWLYNQHLSRQNAALYEFSYQLIYLLPLLLTLIIYVLLVRLKRLEKFKDKINSIGLLYLLVIGLLLIIYPFALSQLLISVLVFLCVFIASLFLKWNNSRSKDEDVR